MAINTLHPQAWHAFRALSLRGQCGNYAARRYAMLEKIIPIWPQFVVLRKQQDGTVCAAVLITLETLSLYILTGMAL